MQDLVLSLDQGTTSTRAMLFNIQGEALYISQQEFPQYFPDNGWVEHDAEEIWSSVKSVMQQAIEASSELGRIVSIGITNQRETVVVWNKETGKPVYRAIVWQDRRTAEVCNELKKQGHEKLVRDKTGLLLDPYFSASKISWILDHVDGARKQAEDGELLFGTIECFLLWRLTNGKSHYTDVTNASRTALMNLSTQQWDDELLTLFNVPKEGLAEIRHCDFDFGLSDKNSIGINTPIQAMIGDQQSALVGQACLKAGMMKSTYGTGAFLMANTGEKILPSSSRMLSTIAYGINGKIHYALEGSIFNAGTSIKWLRDQLKIIKDAKETEDIANSLSSNEGVYFVTAFTGLGAPHWNAEARATIVGLTRDSKQSHIVRAALESVVYQTMDVVQAIQNDGQEVRQLRIDGGMSNNDWLAQFMADIINVEVSRPKQTETTALGAAYIAALKAGLMDDISNIIDNWKHDRSFTTKMPDTERKQYIEGWEKALRQTLST